MLSLELFLREARILKWFISAKIVLKDLGEVIDIMTVPRSVPEKTTFCCKETYPMIFRSKSIYF